MIKLFYFNEASWEPDYIINDILYNIKLDIEFINIEIFNSLINRNDIIEKNILVIGRSINKINIDVIKYIKPIVIIALSDELDEYANQLLILEKHTKLILRQYNHNSSLNKKNSLNIIPKKINLAKHTKLILRQYNHNSSLNKENNYQIPVGYSKNYLNNKNSLDIITKKINQREINCSFIGVVKYDRSHMIEIFKNNMKNTKIICVDHSFDINKLPISPQECFNIYNNSIFVICGRGYNLECFRNYEAIVAGAIPVVVASNDMIKKTYYFNGNLPPFIFEETWEKAIIRCNELLNDLDNLQKMQDNLIFWWKNYITFINDIVIKTLEK